MRNQVKIIHIRNLYSKPRGIYTHITNIVKAEKSYNFTDFSIVLNFTLVTDRWMSSGIMSHSFTPRYKGLFMITSPMP